MKPPRTSGETARAVAEVRKTPNYQSPAMKLETTETHPLAVLRGVTARMMREGQTPIEGIPAPVQYVVLDASPSARFPYVAARPGFYRSKDGKQVRDKSCALTSGPEMTECSKHALRFKSHRAAARVASRLASPRIVTV